jgi:hypothetical protein
LKVGTLNRVLNEISQHLGWISKNYYGDCSLRGLASSPDGRLLASVSWKEIKLWGITDLAARQASRSRLLLLEDLLPPDGDLGDGIMILIPDIGEVIFIGQADGLGVDRAVRFAGPAEDAPPVVHLQAAPLDPFSFAQLLEGDGVGGADAEAGPAGDA